MHYLHLIFLLTAQAFFCATVFAQPNTWDVANEVPDITQVGPYTDEELDLSETLRQELMGMLAYWQRLGLEDPPDLDGIYNINDTSHIRLQSLVAILNPDIANIELHVASQYNALMGSEFAEFITWLDKRFAIGKGFFKREVERSGCLLDAVFDWYALRRYGYAVPRFAQHIKTNPLMRNINSHFTGGMPIVEADNAYFVLLANIDIAQILPAADSNKSGFDIDLIVNREALDKLMHPRGEGSRRIVILPRTTEMTGDLEVTTLADSSVVGHEYGHHIVHAQPSSNRVPRLIDEVLADYFITAAREDPVLGQWFAKASKVIAQRLVASSPSAEDIRLAQNFKRVADIGFVRRMDEITDLAALNRYFHLNDDYSMGDPLRNMLWDLHSSGEFDVERVDRLVLLTLKRFALLPQHLSPRTQWALVWRNLLGVLRKNRQASRAEKQVLAEMLNKFAKELVQPSEEILADLMTMHEEETGKPFPHSNHSLIRRLKRKAKAIAFDLYKREIGLKTGPLEQEALANNLTTIEDRAERWRRVLGWFGYGRRPRINADYLLPEFIRVLHQTAQIEYPEVANRVRQLSGPLLGNAVGSVKVGDNQSVLFFPRRSTQLFNPVIRSKVASLLTQRFALQQRLATWQTAAAGDDKEYKSILQQYEHNLDQLGEFERSGAAWRLWLPYPLFTLAKATKQITIGVGRAALRMLRKSTDCRTHFESLPADL